MPLLFSDNKRAALECLLFVAGEPVAVERLALAVDMCEQDINELVTELMELYSAEGRGLQIRKVAGGFQMCTRPEYAAYIESFLKPEIPALSVAALETLAIIAYRQPITRAEIEFIRGVKTEGVLANLINRGLVRETGRKETPGRPILYGTTKRFLEFLGLNNINELPPVNINPPAD